MELAANTVLVTGGASGIGLALAERFLRAGSEVILCGRRAEKLREAQAVHPGMKIRVCDVASEAERLALRDWAAGDLEIPYGFAAQSSRASREELDAIFQRMNAARS